MPTGLNAEGELVRSSNFIKRNPEGRDDGWVPAQPYQPGGPEHTPEQPDNSLLLQYQAFLNGEDSEMLPSNTDLDDRAIQSYCKSKDILFKDFSAYLRQAYQALQLFSRREVLESRFDLAEQKSKEERSKRPNYDEWVFDPITPQTVRLASPSSILNLDGATRGLIRGASAVETFIHEESGDLIWHIDPESGSKFVAVEPVFEEATRGEADEPIPLQECTFEEVVGTLDKLRGIVSFDIKNPNEEFWSLLTPVLRLAYLKAEIVNPDDLRLELADCLPTKKVPGEWQGTYRYGLKLVEENSAGEQETTMVYLRREVVPLHTPDNNDYDQVRGPSQRPGWQPTKVVWFADVTCASGTQTTYEFGDPALVGQQLTRKPVFYAYSDQKMDAKFTLTFAGKMTAEYPTSQNGTWKFTVGPSGTLTTTDGNEYPYGFWEGIADEPYGKEFSEGYCVAGSDVVVFLEEKLTHLGLNQKERTDFITYWFPVMQANRYNFVRFLEEEYTDKANFEITPKPDTLIRVFMVFKASTEMVELPKQTLTSPTRSGFAVVEWGGANLDELV